MRERNEQMIQLLEEYPSMKKKIALLRYELKHRKDLSSSEMIVAMSFQQGSGEGQRPSGQVSDPTVRIAMNYQDAAKRINSEARAEILSELVQLEQEADRLEYYASLLNERQAAVIRLMYFQRLPVEEIASQIGVVPRTVRKIRESAVEELAQMYDFTGHLK